MKKTNKYWVPIIVAVITFGSLFAFAGRDHFSRFGPQHGACHGEGMQNGYRHGGGPEYNNCGARSLSDTTKLPAAITDTTKH